MQSEYLLTLIFKFCNNIDKVNAIIRGGVMEAYLKKIVLQYLCGSFLMIGLCMPWRIDAELIELNFDTLFPVSWYQKGLVSIIRVWHIIAQVVETRNEQLPLDLMLGTLAFGQFCIERIHTHDRCVSNNEDIMYGIMVVHKIQSLLAMVNVAPAMRDRADCIVDMLVKIEKNFNFLYIPSNIQTICSARDVGIKCSFACNLEVIK